MNFWKLFLTSLCWYQKRQHAEASEAALIEIIQHRLTSEEQDRLNYLRSSNESGEITEAEHQELLMYVERVEQQDAERAEALIQLAQLRSCDLKMLFPYC